MKHIGCFRKTLSREMCSTAQHVPKELFLAEDVLVSLSRKATLNGTTSFAWFVTGLFLVGILFYLKPWSLENTAVSALLFAFTN
jgi:hypothetical protein